VKKILLIAEIIVKEPGGQEAIKTNTVLLLDRNQKFMAFGSKALDSYFNDNKECTDLLFEKFKMILLNSRTGCEPLATALNGMFFTRKEIVFYS
jgi:hypothetical protein